MMDSAFSIAAVFLELESDNLLPAIVFRSSRSQCDADVERLAMNQKLQLEQSEQRNLRDKINEVVAKYELDMDLVVSHPQYPSLIRAAVGAHHAGQLLMWRLLLEELMSAGLLRMLIATGTVAAGVDFPARSVVMTAHSRRAADGYANFLTSDFQQMSGRAGRRGKDTVGFCIAVPSRFCDARVLAKIAQRPVEPLSSSYYPSPSTVLNLMRYRSVSDLRYIIERSLASFYDRNEARKMVSDARNMLEAISPELAQELSFELRDLEQLREELSESKNFSGRTFSAVEKKVLKRIRSLARQAEELIGKQLTNMERTIDGLRSLGYISVDTLTPKGVWAANLCTSYVLEIGEAIAGGLFDKCSTVDLIAMVASICGDPFRNYSITEQRPLKDDQVAALQSILDKVSSLELPGVQSDHEVLDGAANSVLTWINAEGWNEFRALLVLKGIAEGDVSRLITMTAEQLNQIARLYESHAELARKAFEGRKLLLRPPLTEDYSG